MGAGGIDVSAFSAGEVRRMMQQAQARGQTVLAEQLARELEWRQRMAREARLAAALDDAESAGVPMRRRRRAGFSALGLTAAALTGAALAGGITWWQTGGAWPPLSKLGLAAAATTAPHVPEPAPSPADPPAPGFGPPPLQGAPGPAAATAVSATSPAPRAFPAHLPLPTYRPSGCRPPATPGERVVCDSASLLAQDQQMVWAYRRALASGANRVAINHDQGRWKRVRNAETDPDTLAALYRVRIGDLDAAARKARAETKRPADRRG